MRRIVLMVLLVCFLLVSVALIGTSFTGFVTYYATSPCQFDSDCPSATMCCHFAGQDAGVCSYPLTCDEIEELTAKEQQAFLEQSPSPVSSVDSSRALAGSSLLVVTLVGAVLWLRSKK